MLVMKFGGTSVGDPEAMTRVAAIVGGRVVRRPAVVVSAVAKTTDELVALATAAARGDRARTVALTEWVVQKHARMVADLGLESSAAARGAIDTVLGELGRVGGHLLDRGEVDRELLDDCLSWGEYLSAHILTAFLCARGIAAEWVDARRVFVTDSRFGRARPCADDSGLRAEELVRGRIREGKIPVLQGFVGRDGEGRITTFGRGGSDYTATFLAALIGAEAVEIWTDVDGIMTADPSLVQGVRRIKRMTFEEAAELAYFGAKVLHPSTILPAVRSGISVFVMNSMKSEAPGTEIVHGERAAPAEKAVIKSIAYKEGLSVIDIKSTRMLMAYGFLATIFDIFNRFETPVDLVSTSEVSVSVTVDSRERLEEIVEALSEVGEVEIRHRQAVVCLVGEGICRRPDLPARIFGELAGVQINLISQGASKINISLVIDEDNLPEVVGRLHRRFFSGPLDEEVFAP